MLNVARNHFDAHALKRNRKPGRAAAVLVVLLLSVRAFADAGQQWLLYEAGPKKSARIALLKLQKSPPPPTPAKVRLDDLLQDKTLILEYETSFDAPLKVASESELTRDGKYVSEPGVDVDWILEGPGRVRVEDGSLHMTCTGGHTVLWNRRLFPADFVAEWSFTHHHHQGLAILFFAAQSSAGGSIHRLGLPARKGVFRNYTKGKIDCYHTSYFAISKQGVPRGETHVRKNPGSNLVAAGPCPLDGKKRGPHRIRVAKLGPRILLEINGEVSIDWTDPAAGGVPPLTHGQIGLRQMKHTLDASYEYFKVFAVKSGQSPGGEPWKRHAIDPGGVNGLSGADGVRLADANGDGLMDTVTGWEEGEAIRVCINPGPEKVKQPWPVVTVSRIKSAEDSVFADLDGDGRLDVVSCTEGGNKTVYFHWAPKNKDDYLKADAWKTEAVPATVKKQSWMFALPMDIHGKHGIDLLVASKGKASVSWLEAPADPRNMAGWKLHKIVDAGWIMTLRSQRNDQKLAPVFVTDRKGPLRGVYRLVPARTANGFVTWKREDIGGEQHEVMFMDLWPKSDKPLVATRNGEILDFSQAPAARIPNPFGVQNGKALRIGDIDLDGQLDIVHTVDGGKQRSKPGITWLKKVEGGWKAFDLGGPEGSKFDRIELLDVDRDGDLDVITCEENAGAKSMGLGLIWYENPTQ